MLGLWASTAGHGESAKYWMTCLPELKNRGAADTFFIVCDGLNGPLDCANMVFPLAIVQQCIVQVVAELAALVFLLVMGAAG